ncbi:MAG: porin [Hyphomicrobiales bacterium]|nr:porin [Hyphomicrobiales bacterium]
MYWGRAFLLGSAAGIVVVSGAAAADAPVKAQPLQYVKICNVYGDGYYYVPGTDTCLKLGGLLRVEAMYNSGSTGVPDGVGGQGQQLQAMYDRARTNDIDFRVRVLTSFDVRQSTQYGTLRTYFRVGVQQATPTESQAGVVFWDRAFMQFAGFTIGKTQSFYDTVTYGGAYSYQSARTVSDTGATGWNVWAYTATLGNGLAATLSLEDPSRNKTVLDTTVAGFAAFPAALVTDNAFNAQSPTNTGFRAPDVIGNLRLDQTWGYAAMAVALHNASGAYYGSPNNVSNGHPADAWGWAVSAGMSFALPGNDRLAFNAQFSEGAAGYGAAIGQNWSMLKPGTSAAWAFTADGVFGNGSKVELTRVWNVIAFYEHFWTRSWRTSWYGGYVQVDYGAAATRLINPAACGGIGAGFAGVTIAAVGNSCNPDFSFYQVGTRTQWNPVPQLDIGLDLVYTRLNTAYRGAATVTPGAPQNAVGQIDDQDVLAANFRWQRNFYP